MAPPRKQQLDKYNAKRDFRATAEPSGKVGKKHIGGLIYMIQKHAASHLHFDFRLEWDGVLKSWAIAKGPSLSPEQKRLAVQVEDHPVDYATFEGTIPKGQYGGGTVMLWDRGTWEPIDDVNKGLQSGRLNFRLHGERLQGEWHLVRMGGKAGGDRRQNWLLIKSDDKFADDGAADKIIQKFTTSIKTNRTMEQIAAGKSAVWQAKKTEQPVKKETSNAQLKKNKSKLPDFVPPQLATLADEPPKGDQWVHEIKFDGYRALVRVDGENIKMITRANNDWTHWFLDLPDYFKFLEIKSALIDGEVVVPNEKGITSFHALQEAMSNDAPSGSELHYYAFDLLYLNGEDLMRLPLRERKNRLREILPENLPRLHFSEDFAGDGAAVFEKSCHMKLEGIISKRADAPYEPGRSKTWLKIKCSNEQEMVIGGFTYQSKHPDRLGALLIGYYKDKKLIFAGKVGTGFTQTESVWLLKKLEKLRNDENPFGTVPATYRRGAHWVRPELLAQVTFTEWTKDGMLRHPSYQGLREDKPARQVVQEKKIKPSAAENPLLTHPDKVLFSDSNITKQQLADYYAQVADLMLPHIKGYPLSLVRCPNGQGKSCFFQRHSDADSADIGQIPINLDGDTSDFITIENNKGLTALVQLSALEIHAWGAKGKTPDQPERIIVDFDPDEAVPFQKVKDAALDMRARLTKLGMESFLKCTGGKGLHVVLPFQKGPSWEEVRAFSEAMAGLMAEDAPELYTVNSRKVVRKGKIYIDYLRNNKAASAIAPYSTRAKPGAPVALPLAWEELKQLNASNQFTLQNFSDWKKRLRHNPWQDLLKLKQKLKLR